MFVSTELSPPHFQVFFFVKALLPLSGYLTAPYLPTQFFSTPKLPQVAPVPLSLRFCTTSLLYENFQREMNLLALTSATVSMPWPQAPPAMWPVPPQVPGDTLVTAVIWIVPYSLSRSPRTSHSRLARCCLSSLIFRGPCPYQEFVTAHVHFMKGEGLRH